MPLKINVGVCKKTGLPDYGFAGSHCDIELEMDHSMLETPDGLTLIDFKTAASVSSWCEIQHELQLTAWR